MENAVGSFLGASQWNAAVRFPFLVLSMRPLAPRCAFIIALLSESPAYRTSPRGRGHPTTRDGVAIFLRETMTAGLAPPGPAPDHFGHRKPIAAFSVADWRDQRLSSDIPAPNGQLVDRLSATYRQPATSRAGGGHLEEINQRFFCGLRAFSADARQKAAFTLLKERLFLRPGKPLLRAGNTPVDSRDRSRSMIRRSTGGAPLKSRSSKWVGDWFRKRDDVPVAPLTEGSFRAGHGNIFDGSRDDPQGRCGGSFPPALSGGEANCPCPT